MKNGMNSSNAYYHSVKDHSSSRLIPETKALKNIKLQFYLLLCMDMELGLSVTREEHTWKFFVNMATVS
jgi:hypothetical protein